MSILGSSHRKLLFLFIVIIFSLISAWVFIKYQLIQKELPPTLISTSTPQSLAVPAQTSTAPTSTTQETKIYRNTEYGFEFQYPQNFTLKEINFPVYVFTDSGEICKNLLQEEFRYRRLLHETALVDSSTKFKTEVVVVSVYENSDNRSLDDWLNSGTKFLETHLEECKYDDKNYIEIRLNDKKNVTLDNTLGVKGFAGCCGVSNKTIYLTKNNRIYKLSFSGSVNNDLKCVPFLENKYSCPTTSENMYNQIIASFKFLNK